MKYFGNWKRSVTNKSGVVADSTRLFPISKQQQPLSSTSSSSSSSFSSPSSATTTLTMEELTNPTFSNQINSSASSSYAAGSIAEKIFQKCSEHLHPVFFIEILNESSTHNVPKGSETHFKVIIVSNQFEGKMAVQRHRLVYNLLKEEMRSDNIPEDRTNYHKIHALSIIAKTESEWAVEKDRLLALHSPRCLGGEKKEK